MLNHSLDNILTQADISIKQYRDILKSAQESIRQDFYNGKIVADLVHQRAAVIDKILRKIWLNFFPEKTDIALIAVGGYGRAELHPASDIDLLILLETENHSDHQTQIEQFLTFLWDIGLEVGQSVRSLSECVSEAKKDITVATNLMESRLLEGQKSLLHQLENQTSPEKIWPSDQFFEAKWQEQINRYQRYNVAFYNLEPNVKGGPGGLRDIQMIGWVAKRHFHANTLHSLVNHHFLSESEYNTLMSCQNFLWKVRFGLHIISKRREEQLRFDLQQELAKQFGYQDDGNHLAVELFMKDYYSSITEVSRLNEMLLQLFQEAIIHKKEAVEITPINRRFQIRNHYIEVTNDQVFQNYHFALLEIFLLLQQNPDIKGIRAQTIRLLRDHCYLIDEKFRHDSRCHTIFMEILRQPTGIVAQLRRMNRYGILAAYIPAFKKLVGLMQFDLFHIYTVDEHILMVVRNLRRFAVPEFFKEYPRCSEIHQTLPKLELLYLAGLFHDIAKGRGGNHAELGEKDAFEFCMHHQLSEYDSRLVAWLVRNHLLMSSIVHRKDINDPYVIHQFAIRISDQTHLDYLYLLTVADIRGTNPALYTDWKNALLSRLYESTRDKLQQGLKKQINQAAHIDSIQSKTLEILEKFTPDSSTTEKLWSNWGNDYFISHTADEIAWHTIAVSKLTQKELPLILVRKDVKQGGTAIFVYAKDQDGIFTVTTKLLDRLCLSIADARIMTTDDGYTLDSYIVLESSGEAIHDKAREQKIIDLLHQHISPPNLDLLNDDKNWTRHQKLFIGKVDILFSQDEKNQRTILEVHCTDQPGLLSKVGQALLACQTRLKNAKIATFGSHVEDLFYITDSNNQPLNHQYQFDQLRETLCKYLGKDSC
ncbi:MAG: [protein-PII] uridylyltransferase [Gammaproteobacteria bacterium]|nr:[protein-PII] uridylyltransferase [Gammaproteobacteria bacterium]